MNTDDSKEPKPGLRLVSKNKLADVDRHRATELSRYKLNAAVTALAANLLRVLAGAGKRPDITYDILTSHEALMEHLHACDIKMDALARRVARTLSGENLFDVASVCGAVAAFAIAEMPVSREEREKMLEQMIRFMRRRVFADAAEFADGKPGRWTHQ